MERDMQDNCVVKVTNKSGKSVEVHEERYKLLNICEFDSTRKRMSCVFQVGNEIVLMCKGADSVIHDMCMSDKSKASKVYKETQKHVNKYANEGLRTLFLAARVMS